MSVFFEVWILPSITHIETRFRSKGWKMDEIIYIPGPHTGWVGRKRRGWRRRKVQLAHELGAVIRRRLESLGSLDVFREIVSEIRSWWRGGSEGETEKRGNMGEKEKFSVSFLTPQKETQGQALYRNFFKKKWQSGGWKSVVHDIEQKVGRPKKASQKCQSVRRRKLGGTTLRQPSPLS